LIGLVGFILNNQLSPARRLAVILCNKYTCNTPLTKTLFCIYNILSEYLSLLCYKPRPFPWSTAAVVPLRQSGTDVHVQRLASTQSHVAQHVNENVISDLCDDPIPKPQRYYIRAILLTHQALSLPPLNETSMYSTTLALCLLPFVAAQYDYPSPSSSQSSAAPAPAPSAPANTQGHINVSPSHITYKPLYYSLLQGRRWFPRSFCIQSCEYYRSKRNTCHLFFP
jgi:hypothetical protein